MSLFKNIIIVILVLIIVALIIRQITITSTLISPADCPVIKGTYAVTPGSTGSALTNCGPTQSEACQFSNVSSLNQAISICNQDPLTCLAFSYSSTTQIVTFIDPSSISNTSSSDTNIYQRQTQATID
jgi:hypothetical protein